MIRGYSNSAMPIMNLEWLAGLEIWGRAINKSLCLFWSQAKMLNWPYQAGVSNTEHGYSRLGKSEV